MHSCCDSSGDDWQPDSRLQSSTHPSSQVRKKSKKWEDGTAHMSDDDDDSSSSPDDSSQMSKSSGTSGSGQKRQDYAFQEPDSSKEWMFHGTCRDTIYIRLGPRLRCRDRRILFARIIASFDDLGRVSNSHSLTNQCACIDRLRCDCYQSQ
jgi:hypothetical protein